MTPRGTHAPDDTAAWPLPIVWLPALLLSLHPLATTLAANAAWLPIAWSDVARTAVASVGGTLAVLALLHRVDSTRGGWATWLAAVILPMVAYGWICDITGAPSEAWPLAAAYTAASLGLATFAVRPWQVRQRDPIPLLIVAVVMLASSGLRAVLLQADDADRARWQQAADALAAPPHGRAGILDTVAPEHDGGATTTEAPRAARDIYYIILDGFGREDVLRDYYDVDLRPFVAWLRSRGFYVPEQAHSNYAQTFLSIASTLNLNYLDGVAAAMGPEAGDRRPLARAIRHNALMALARRSGYEIVAIASDYEATQAFDGIDRCWCQRFGASGFEQAVIGATPLAALPLARWTLDSHGRKVRESFAALAAAGHPGRPTFVFAHVVAPHPPFVFNADGSRRVPSHTLAGFRDGSHFPGSRDEYVAGYRAQTQFVVRQLTDLVTALLDRPGPSPVIVMHGDHGPGLTLDWDNPRRSDLRERFSIFAAYRLPDDGPALYQTMTPVNGVRSLATRYLGVALPPLPDRSHFSPWMRPFDDLTVTTH